MTKKERETLKRAIAMLERNDGYDHFNPAMHLLCEMVGYKWRGGLPEERKPAATQTDRHLISQAFTEKEQ